MLSKFLILLGFTFFIHTASAAPDCFIFNKVDAQYNSPLDFKAEIELSRTLDGKVFTVTDLREQGIKQAITLFNEIFNLTDSKKYYESIKGLITPFDLKTSPLSGSFSAFDFQEYFLCTTRYTVIPKDWSLYFTEYEIFKAESF